MIKRCAINIFSVALLLFAHFSTAAQPLPKIRLRPTFPALTLDRPVWMCQAPGGSDNFFVVEQPGRILLVPKGSDGSHVKEFLNIEDRGTYIEAGPNTGIGLMSIAFHPGFKTNGLFYIFYSQQNTNRTGQFPGRNVISEFKVSSADPDRADLASERILLEVPEPFRNNQGGQLGFGPDGYLYIALGDGGSNNDPFNSGQNPGSLLGKILRIDVNTRSATGAGKDRKELPYGIPADNPWVNEPEMNGNSGARKETYAWGLRKVWRYSWDPRPATCGQATSASASGRKWTSSSRAAIMAGACAKGRTTSSPDRPARNTLIRSSNIRTRPDFWRNHNFRGTASASVSLEATSIAARNIRHWTAFIFMAISYWARFGACVMTTAR